MQRATDLTRVTTMYCHIAVIFRYSLNNEVAIASGQMQQRLKLRSTRHVLYILYGRRSFFYFRG